MSLQGGPAGGGSFERSMTAYYVQPDGTRVPFTAALCFDKADPYAVGLRLRTTDVRTVTWTFARQLLIDGIRRPAGVGAVEVRPDFHGDSRLLALSLTSASGRADVQLPYAPVAAFLRDAYAAVPPGAEGDQVDWNAELARLRDDSR
ncbi:Sporulation-specific cell division protein SsgB [Frankia sp. AiPs1]|uniref:SsgA family sporulation/cell division regulator n=1 Tax=Frankia sp. AiPa1 TaxID=573492 RepID=UPI00202AF875|nr:SsgA family sporulation/cell division regulator [Frankia sp. AiPa1]MCL9762609.1 SsgA family sporulation/cell division regulator [Frankia sp. AiPa1]